MIYADTDFFLALMTGSAKLKRSGRRILDEFRGAIWTSPITLIELLLVSAEFKIDPQRLLLDVFEIAKVDEDVARYFLIAANHMTLYRIGVYDALHAAYCEDQIFISSDKVFDKLVLKRIPLKE